MTNQEKDQIVAGMYIDLLKVQQAIKDVSKDATNPFFHSRYATLGSTIEACKDILNANNFVVLQPIQSDQDGVYVCTTLIHVSGGKIESRLRINQKEQNNPQAQGSAITYARRYALQSLLCMNADDDDGNNATRSNTTKAPIAEPTRAEVKAMGVCPKDGGKLIAKTTPGGKEYLKCQNGGWNSELKVSTGCDYVLWSTPKKTWDSKEPYKSGKTMTAEEYDKNGQDFDIPDPEFKE